MTAADHRGLPTRVSQEAAETWHIAMARPHGRWPVTLYSCGHASYLAHRCDEAERQNLREVPTCFRRSGTLHVHFDCQRNGASPTEVIQRLTQTVDRYSRVQIALHWIVVILVAFQFVANEPMCSAWRAFLDGQLPSGFFDPSCCCTSEQDR